MTWIVPRPGGCLPTLSRTTLLRNGHWIGGESLDVVSLGYYYVQCFTIYDGKELSTNIEIIPHLLT